MTTSTAPSFRDNAALHRFELDVDGGTALALYRLAPGMMTIYHTEVPPRVRERGVGSRLVQGALEQARARGLKVVPRCPFVRHFIQRHPEFEDLLA